MKQVEILEKTPLLDEKGEVLAPGYCVYNNYIYNREDVKANPMRIKQWDFYQISDSRYTVQMTVADISFGGGGNVSVIDRETGKRVDRLNLSIMPRGSLVSSKDGFTPHFLHNKGNNFDMRIQVTPEKRFLTFEGLDSKKKPLKIYIEMDIMPDLQSLTMAVPFKEKGHFYLNQKVNCMPSRGRIETSLGSFDFDEYTAFGVLDWGRGVWPYKCKWYWGNASTYLPDGKIFGFEIGWGFGEMYACTENTLFYEGKAHKIGMVFLEKDETDYMKPWIFTSNDGRFEMTMTPMYDNYTSSRVGLIGNRCHQVFGKWNGEVTLDCGTRLKINNMTAFCEYSDNRW